MKILNLIADTLWGAPLIAFILCVGGYYSYALGFIQIRGIGKMFKSAFASFKGSKNAFASFSLSLAATVGTGSVLGIATAISLGGAGAVFWMWISALFGMAISYAEGFASIKYREHTADGYVGGMMYIIKLGIGSPFLGKVYALFATLACFGMGIAAQTNSISQSLSPNLNIGHYAVATVMALLVGVCIASKNELIGKACSLFVPILSVGYILLTLTSVLANCTMLPKAFCAIFTEAFGLKPLVGGTLGYGIKTAVSQGIRRGIFSTESGLGTTAAIHAKSIGITAQEQGYINMFEVFVDTFVISTLTALMILTSGAYNGESADSIALLVSSCEIILGNYSGIFIALACSVFAIATAVGWSRIGMCAFSFLTDGKLVWLYCFLCMASAYFGAIYPLEGVFAVCDIANALMALPSLTAIIMLGKEVSASVKPCR